MLLLHSECTWRFNIEKFWQFGSSSLCRRYSLMTFLDLVPMKRQGQWRCLGFFFFSTFFGKAVAELSCKKCWKKFSKNLYLFLLERFNVEYNEDWRTVRGSGQNWKIQAIFKKGHNPKFYRFWASKLQTDSKF